jgi:hypothetical protein
MQQIGGAFRGACRHRYSYNGSALVRDQPYRPADLSGRAFLSDIF